jgi:hypothetical protein
MLSFFLPRIQAQFFEDGGPVDSFTVHFDDLDTNHFYIPDTAMVPLWQLGRTHKSFFTNDTNAVKMMTDTVNSYPVNANNSFILRIPHLGHTLIRFWHRYQTTIGADGGIVEYSRDKGDNWYNVKDSCNIDGTGDNTFGINTAGFYTLGDTIHSHDAAFSGVCDTTRKSAFQFAGAWGVKSTAGYHCSFYSVDTVYVRFRFSSDTTADTLAGWMIDSVQVTYFLQTGIVHSSAVQSALQVVPSPSSSGIFTFPALNDKRSLTAEVYDIYGRRVVQTANNNLFNLSHLPQGVYYYRILHGTNLYTGRLIYD